MRFITRYTFLTILFLSNLLFCQQEKKSISLQEAIVSIEKKHNVKLSYADQIVKGKNILNFNINLSLEQQLRKLQQLTNLIFNKVSDRYILVLEKDVNSYVCGYVKDKLSNTPIIGASIYLADKSLGTVSDENGYFELSGTRKTDTLLITFLGYKPLRELITKKKNTKCTSYKIEEDIATLDEVLITSYLTNGIVKKNSGGLEVQPQKRGILPGLTEPDVLQSLQLLPDIQSPSETTSGLHIRGGTPDHNLVLFDGIRIYNPAHFFGMISAFNPYIIDKVTVQTGGVSANYGNHIAGVIDITTDSKIDTKISGGFGTNLTHSDAFLKLPLSKNTAVHVAGRRALTDVFNSITFNKISDRVFQNSIIGRNEQNDTQNVFEKDNNFFFNDLHVKLLSNLGEKDHVNLSTLYINNKLNYKLKNENLSLSETDDLSVQNFGISGNWNRNWTDKVVQKTTVYFSKYNLDYNFKGEQNVGFPIVESATKKNEIKEFSIKTSLHNYFNQKHQLSLGLEYTSNDVGYTLKRTIFPFPDDLFDDELAEIEDSNTTISLFSEYQLKKKKDFNVSLGLRSSYFSIEKKLTIEPRLFVQSKIATNLWLNASFEKKYQNISQLIEFATSDFGLENNVWSLSNSNEIPILEADHFSFGLVFKNKDWLFDLNAYYKNVSGLTSLSRLITTNSETILNGTSTTKGITALLKRTFNNYTSWMSYSFGKSDFTFPLTNNGNSFPDNNDIRHSFFWSHNYHIGQFDFSLGWNYRTGIPFTNVIETNENGVNDFAIQEINGERLIDYHRLDFSSTYQFNLSKNKHWKGKIGVSFLNLYNRSNRLQKRFFIANDGSDNLLIDEETRSLGFTPNIVFRVEF